MFFLSFFFFYELSKFYEWTMSVGERTIETKQIYAFQLFFIFPPTFSADFLGSSVGV